jgi:hypothetical protein
MGKCKEKSAFRACFHIKYLHLGLFEGNSVICNWLSGGVQEAGAALAHADAVTVLFWPNAVTAVINATNVVSARWHKWLLMNFFIIKKWKSKKKESLATLLANF